MMRTNKHTGVSIKKLKQQLIPIVDIISQGIETGPLRPEDFSNQTKKYV